MRIFAYQAVSQSWRISSQDVSPCGLTIRTIICLRRSCSKKGRRLARINELDISR